MKTIFSKLNLVLNTALDEKVCIGLVMSNNEKTIFKFSLTKLSAIKALLSAEQYRFVKKYLTSLENDINNNVSTINLKQELNWVSESYLSYLSRYANNTIQFTTPQNIDVNLNIDNFKKLFEKYVFAYEIEKDKNEQVSIFHQIEKTLYPKIKDKVNFNRKLNASDIKSLITPIEIDFIGMNGLPVTGQILDFEKQHYHLENDIARYISLTQALNIDIKKKGKYFVIGKEPNKKEDVKNHLLWSSIYKSSIVEFVHSNEIEKIEEYIQSKNVQPFFND